jgi:hypothetical protein
MDIIKIRKSKIKYEEQITQLVRKFEKENGVFIEAINVNEPHILCITHNIPYYKIQIKIKNPFKDI